MSWGDAIFVIGFGTIALLALGCGVVFGLCAVAARADRESEELYDHLFGDNHPAPQAWRGR